MYAKVLRLLAIPGLLVGVGPAAPAEPNKALAPLQGSWKLVSVEINGMDMEVPKNPPRWVIKGNRVRYAGKELAVLTVDPTTTPRNIDLTFVSPKRILEGVYAVDKDMLKLCINRQTDGVKERPQGFDTKDKAEWRLLVFTRDKPGEGTKGLDGFVGIQIAAGPNPNEVVIGAVIKGSPAEKAGVKKDDLLIKVGTEEATGVRQVVALVRQAAPGSELTLRVKRDGKERDIGVKVGVLPFFFLD